MTPSFHQRPDGRPDLAYDYQAGSRADLPTLVFLTGFRSDMLGTKAEYLAQYCAGRGQSMLRFDYSGHGQSGGAFEDGTIGLWLKDTLDIIDAKRKGPLLIVGSSMGGWIALLAALARKDRIKGLIGLAAAPDFTKDIPKRMSEEQTSQMTAQGYFSLGNDYAGPYIITRQLIEEGDKHCLLHAPIDLSIPVRLIQGMKDTDVEWQMAHRISNTITGIDKKVYLIEEGDHRLSRPEDLQLLAQLVSELSGD